MELPERKLPRLQEYDYSTPGAYFITICTHEKRCLFGKIIPSCDNEEAHIQYSHTGRIAERCLLDIDKHYDNVVIDNWVIMPNHIHLLIRIEENINTPLTAKRNDIPNIVGKFKAAVTRAARAEFAHNEKLWQSSYHDHIIRGQKDYAKIWEYIKGNPAKWLEDCFYIEQTF